MTDHALHSFFWPRSIAVLGASPDIHRIRGRLLRQLRENEFPGRILPINPSYQEIGGLHCFPSIAAVGAPIDLALVAIPAAGVASALQECATAGVKNALIIARVSPRRAAPPAPCRPTCSRSPGAPASAPADPNCEGYFNALGRIAATFSPTVETRRTKAAVLAPKPRRRDRAVRRHRVRPVQSRQGRRNRHSPT